jgi:hypothetical protein
VWDTNLGPRDLVDVTLSVDGAGTFGTILAGGIAASAKSAKFVVPVLGAATASARIGVRWTNAPAGTTISATSPINFTLAPPFVRVTSPNGGEVWVVGNKPVIRWAHNLGTLEGVAIHLSLNGGSSYGYVVVGGTVSDASHGLTVVSSTITPAGRVRVSWLKDQKVADASDGTFQVLPAP